MAPGACTAAGTQDLSGRALNRAPKLTYSLGGEYRARLAPEWSALLMSLSSIIVASNAVLLKRSESRLG